MKTLRFGLVSEIGTGENAGFARVFFDEDDFVSHWLHLPSFGSKELKIWTPVHINCQVACIVDEWCEQGFIAAVLWSDTDTPPEWANEENMGIHFPDGAVVKYDWKNKKLEFNAPDSEIEINCKSLKLKGDFDVDGGLTTSGDIIAKGAIDSEKEITANSSSSPIPLAGHTHPSAPSGPTTLPMIFVPVPPTPEP